MTSIGFTATRTVTPELREAIMQLFRRLDRDATIVTGGCRGGDALIAREAFAYGMNVHVILPANHSQVDPEWELYCTSSEQMPPGTDYRMRNMRIVELSDTMHGFADRPEKHGASRRSGTWQTIRLAQRSECPIQVHIVRG